MFNPVELTALNGERITVNFDQVATIHQGYGPGVYYGCLMLNNGKFVRVRETYDDIADMFEWDEEEDERY